MIIMITTRPGKAYGRNIRDIPVVDTYYLLVKDILRSS